MWLTHSAGKYVRARHASRHDRLWFYGDAKRKQGCSLAPQATNFCLWVSGKTCKLKCWRPRISWLATVGLLTFCLTTALESKYKERFILKWKLLCLHVHVASMWLIAQIYHDQVIMLAFFRPPSLLVLKGSPRQLPIFPHQLLHHQGDSLCLIMQAQSK